MHRVRTIIRGATHLGPLASQITAQALAPLFRQAPALGAAPFRAYSSSAQESFLNGTSSTYVEEMYNSWLADPKSVHVVRITVYKIKIFSNFNLFSSIIFLSYLKTTIPVIQSPENKSELLVSLLFTKKNSKLSTSYRLISHYM